MTSTFSRASDAPSQNVEQLTNSKPDFNVVSLLKEHPSRTSDARTSGSSDPDKLDFGSVHKLYGTHDGDHHGHHHEGGHHHHHHDGNDGGKDAGADSAKDDSSLPVELVDAADEIKRAQEAFKNGDPDRAKEWLQHADKNLRALTGDDSSPGDKCGGSDSGHGGGSDSGHEGGSDSGHEGGSDSGHEGGSDSGHEGGSEGGSEAPPPSDQQIQLQQMIATLAQALQALANGDMQQFQQLLSGLLAQVNQMMPPEQGGTGGTDEPPTGGTEHWTSVPGIDINDPTGSGDGSINPITGLPNPLSGLPNPFTGLPGFPELPGLPHFSNDGSNSDNGFQLPGLPSIQLPGFPNLNGSDNSSGGIQLSGLPSIELPGLPSIQLPGLPSIGNGSDNGIGIPGLPNLPGLPELPNLPGLPGLSGGGSDSHSGGLPKLPGLPDLGDIFDIF